MRSIEKDCLVWAAAMAIVLGVTAPARAADIVSTYYVSQNAELNEAGASQDVSTELSIGPIAVANDDHRSFLQFDLGGLDSATVKRATLRFYFRSIGDWGGANLHPVLAPWTPGTLTYNFTVGSSIGSCAGGSGAVVPAGWYEIEVLDTVRAWQQTPSSNHGFSLRAVEPNFGGTQRAFDSAGGANPPELVIVQAPVTNFYAWDRTMPITFSGYSGSETLTYFPVLVAFSNNVGGSGFAYSEVTSATGADLRFTADDKTTELAYEIERWDTNGVSLVWVQVPDLRAGGNIHAYWGKTGATAPAYTTSGTVWDGNGFLGVWHLAETNGTALDATLNGFNLTPVNGATQGVAAVVGNGVALDGIDDVLRGLGTGAGSYARPTFSFWARPLSSAGSYPGFLSTCANSGSADVSTGVNIDMGPSVQTSFTYLNVEGIGAGGGQDLMASSYAFGGWHHITVLASTGLGAIKVYIDGTLEGSRDRNASSMSMNDIRVGSRYYSSLERGYFDGGLDEVRIETVIRSVAWLQACYSNQVPGSTFLSFGQAVAADALAVTTRAEANVGTGTATLRGEVLALGGAENPKVYFCWGYTNSGTVATSDWPNVTYAGEAGTGTIFSVALDGLYSDAGYVYQCYATNSSGSAWSLQPESFRTDALALTTWLNRMKLSFPIEVTETLTDFPVLVVLSNNVGNSGFSYDGFASPQGDDLRFSDSNRLTELEYEIETWDPNGVSYVWVRLPELTSTNDYIYALWGNPDVLAPDFGAGAVWASAFAGVWHLGADSGSTAPDATLHGRDGILQNMEPTDWTGGAIGNGLQLQSDGTGEYIDGLGSGTVPVGSTPFTVSAWFRRSATATGNEEILSQWTSGTSGNSFFFGFTSGGNIRFSDSWSSINIGTYANSTWHHLVAVNESANARIYLDGVLKVSRGGRLTYTGLGPLLIGKQGTLNSEYYTGGLDEVRVETVARSSEWIRACWLNQQPGGGFISYEIFRPAGTVISIR